jgi:DNA-binding LacI/PurR family transcriptional regulator
MAHDPLNSIYDLAKKTGVSVSTVSRVMNQRGRISLETRQRVLAAARDAGFRPRMAARQITVAVVLDRMRYVTFGGFVSSLLTHVVDCLSKQDVAVEIYTENSVDRLGSRFIDGVLAMSWDDPTIDKLRQLRAVPVVLINRMDVPTLSSVATDHIQGGRLVGDYLLQRGHRRIAFLAEEADWGAQQRIHGLSATLEAAGVNLPPELIGYTQHQPLYGVLRRIIAQKPTAIFLAGEDLALEASFILTEVLGVQVPKDLSVVGIENAKVSQFVRPPHTTLCQPLDRLAEAAMQLLMQHITRHDATPRRELLENTLLERESVAAPPPAGVAV